MVKHYCDFCGTMECEDNIHDWENSSWGVIIGVSKCKKCGKVAKEEDFHVQGELLWKKPI